MTVQHFNTILYDGEASALSSINERGPFDILPHHENFISLIKEKITLRFNGREEKSWQFTVAILKAYNDVINVFVEGVGGK